MIGAPPYRQLSVLLWFLREALRADQELRTYLGDPNQVVAAVMEHDPFAVQDQGEIRLLDTELPLLAIWEVSSRVKPRQRLNGEQVQLGLAYVFRVYQGSAELSPQAWAQRISKLVWWRICYWLRRKRFDSADDPFDLMDIGGIDSIRAVGAQRMGSETHEGILATMEMTHFQPPYEDHMYQVLKTIDLELHPGTVVPSTTGPILEGLIDVDSTD